MKTKIIITPAVVIGVFLAITLSIFAYWIYLDNLDSSGRLYQSQSKMCEEFAKSYLRTMWAKEKIDDLGGDRWERAIAVESEIYKLCQLELTDEALENYSPTNIQKYLNEYRYR